MTAPGAKTRAYYPPTHASASVEILPPPASERLRRAGAFAGAAFDVALLGRPRLFGFRRRRIGFVGDAAESVFHRHLDRRLPREGIVGDGEFARVQALEFVAQA